MNFLMSVIIFLFMFCTNNIIQASIIDDPDNAIIHNQSYYLESQSVFSNRYLLHCILLQVNEDDLPNSYQVSKNFNQVMNDKIFWFEYLRSHRAINLNVDSSHLDFNKILNFFLKDQLFLVKDYYQYLSSTGTFYASGTFLDHRNNFVSIFDLMEGVRKVIRIPEESETMIVNKLNAEDGFLWGLYRNESDPDDVYFKTYKCFVNSSIEPQEPIMIESTKNVNCMFTHDVHVDFYKYFTSDYEVTAESVYGQIILGRFKSPMLNHYEPFLVYKDYQGHFKISDCFVNFALENNVNLSEIEAKHVSRDGRLIAFTVIQRIYARHYWKMSTFFARMNIHGTFEDLIDYDFLKVHSFSYNSQSAVGTFLDTNKEPRIFKLFFQPQFTDNKFEWSESLGINDFTMPPIQAASRDHRVVAIKLQNTDEQCLWIQDVGLLSLQKLLRQIHQNLAGNFEINFNHLHVLQISDCGSVISFKRIVTFDMDNIASSYIAVLPELLPQYFNILKKLLSNRPFNFKA